jgi:hypothetical protein
MEMPSDAFEMLGNRIVAFAKQAIVEAGFLIPISAVVSLDGEVVPSGFYSGELASPPS